jgi:hypothetical protein
MPNHDAQHTDRENSKPVPSCTVRDNDLKVNGRGGLQDVAREKQPDPLDGKFTTRVEPHPVQK